MQWSKAYTTAVAWGLLNSSTSSAFVVTPQSSSRSLALNVGGLGWDNDNFLEALGSGQEALDKANEEYRRQSRFGGPVPDDEDEPSTPPPPPPPQGQADELPDDGIAGASITEEQKEAIKRAHEEDPTQGGQMFKTLLERAQTGGVSRIPPPPPPPPPQQPAAMPANFDNLTVEQQAELFRQMMAGQQPVIPPPTAPISPPSTLPKPPQPGRPVGRNRDADAIVNSSDVYFAQLKLDSSLRNLARYSGDVDKANQPFSDPAIHEIKAHVNPYLEEIKEKERALIETSPDEMIDIEALRRAAEAQRNVDKSYAGVSYKERLAQRKASKQDGGAAAAPAPKQPEAKVEAPPEAKVEAPPEPEVETPPEPKVEAPLEPKPPEPFFAAKEAASVMPEPVNQPEAPPSPPQPAAVPFAEKDEDEKRRDVRTLMGLLLKHRGGPGFGSGRLQGADIELFEDLTMEILVALKEEAKSNPNPLAQASDDAAVRMEEATSDLPKADRMPSLIAVIEGAITMYKNSPPELREGVLVTLRAALLTAINSLNDVIPGEAPAIPESLASQAGTTAKPPAAGRVDSMIACIEGATTMYKNSPPELQSSIVVSLRAALLVGIGTLNELIAGNEVKNLDSYRTAVSESKPDEPEWTPAVAEDVASGQASTPPAPAPLSAAVPSTAPVAPREPAKGPVREKFANVNEANTPFFQVSYDKLERAKGEGKMGLRPDLTPAEADELADAIAEMRTRLVEELDLIRSPKAKATEQDSSGATSKYQEMLAKARAEKEAKKNSGD